MGRPKEVTDEEITRVARRCFIERGAKVSANEIGRELGVSHTTLFNRFGSKEGLMLAALGPPREIVWIESLEAGPDEGPLRDQLVAHARVISAYFHELQQGFAVLFAAGIDPGKARNGHPRSTAPERAHAALIGWLTRAQQQRRIGDCDVETLAATLLGALHGWAFTARACGRTPTKAANARYVEGFVDLLWNGIGEKHPLDTLEAMDERLDPIEELPLDDVDL